MKKNVILVVFVIFVTVTTANAKLRNTMRNAKALQDYLNSSPEIRHTNQKKTLIDYLRILNTQYKIPIFLVTSNNQKKTAERKIKKSLTKNSNKFQSRKTGYLDHVEHKYERKKKRNFADNVNTVLNMSPLKSEANALRRPPSNPNHHESIANFIYPNINVQKLQTLKKLASNLNEEKYKNTNVRAFKSSLNQENYKNSNAETIPVYFIMSSKAAMRTEIKKTPKHTKFFDNKGMIYITKPKAMRNGQSRISILDDLEAIDRRSYSGYDLTRKNQKALKSFVNQQLNKKLVAKTAMRRFLDKYDKEYNFNDLVI